MDEELGIIVKPLKCVWHWISPLSELTLWGWTAEWTGGEIKADPCEVAEVLWLTDAEVISHADAMPTNPAFVQSLIDAKF